MKHPPADFALPARSPRPRDLTRTTRFALRISIAMLVLVCGASIFQMHASARSAVRMAAGHDALQSLNRVQEIAVELHILEFESTARGEAAVRREWRVLVRDLDTARSQLRRALVADGRPLDTLDTLDQMADAHVAGSAELLRRRAAGHEPRTLAELEAQSRTTLAQIVRLEARLEDEQVERQRERARAMREGTAAAIGAMLAALALVLGVGISSQRVVERELTQRAAAEEARDQMAEEVAMQAEELQAQNGELLDAAEQLRVARESADAANRAKSEFLATMSHELRTPLNSVIGFTNVLRKNRRGVLDAGDLRYLERIAANASHLLGLINQVLDLAKIEAGRVEVVLAPTDVGVLAGDVVRQLEGNVAPGVELRADRSDAFAPFVTDADKLRQVLINLVGNALKFTRQGSVVVRVAGDGRGRVARIEVADTGIGMTEEQALRIFDAFEQGGADRAREFGGTGLGLSISRALCQALGYDLSVHSAPGRGSTFAIDLEPAQELRRAS